MNFPSKEKTFTVHRGKYDCYYGNALGLIDDVKEEISCAINGVFQYRFHPDMEVKKIPFDSNFFSKLYLSLDSENQWDYDAVYPIMMLSASITLEMTDEEYEEFKNCIRNDRKKEQEVKKDLENKKKQDAIDYLVSQGMKIVKE